jgi:ABC-2 type transport system ATP-binding protein
MDDVEALCSEVTILSLGRVVFSGPLSKLASENRELDYRLVTSDSPAARAIAEEIPGLIVRAGDDLVVGARHPALDELVTRLVQAGIAIRELSPVVSPLEAAFLALTGDQE